MTSIDEEILELIKEVNPENPIEYVKDLVQEMAYAKLVSRIKHCQDCSICTACKELPYGNINASVMIIGSMPEEEPEDDKFAMQYGESKRVLDVVLDALEINRDEILFTNCIPCWPHKKLGDKVISRVPTSAELSECRVFVEHLIEIVNPLLIITLGPVAYNYFNKEGILTKCRGEWTSINGIPSIPTYAPSYFSKSVLDEITLQSQKEEFVQDLAVAFNYIESNYPNIQIKN